MRSPPLAVHVSVRWGDHVVGAARIDAARPVILGSGGLWPLPEEALGSARFELLRPDPQGVRLATVGVLGPGARARLCLGESFAIDVDVEAEDGMFARRLRAPVIPAIRCALGSALAHGLAMVALCAWTPPMGAAEADAESSADQVAYMTRVLEAHAAPERDPPPQDLDDDVYRQGDAKDTRRSGGTGSRAAGVEAAEGDSLVRTARAWGGSYGPVETPSVRLARAAALREASQFGLIGLLNAGPKGSPSLPIVTWGTDISAARDEASARALFGSSIDDAFAWGGTGLSGTGEGGGGRGESIGLGEIAPIGRGAGTGSGADFGPGDGFGWGSGCACGKGTFGRMGGHHETKAPRLREADVQSGERLPAEVIRRVVRQSFGRFRLCYQRGLQKHPDLRGRVATRFVIDRSGAVAVAADAGSDLPDRSVVDCVVRSFVALSFPEPSGGSVNVTYPIVFEPE